ncbi:MAG: RNA polymerase subunit sigma-24 [Clostridiales bacterium GWF2_36_10]|nr:MAG: RNA polymerase subunit sigma-24 [Clostridiales bacterium GWF2_36_10]
MENILTSGSETSDSVIDLYKDMVYRIALTHTGNKHDADDIFQEVFLRYIQKSIVFDSEKHRKAWFIRVTINCSRKLFSSSWFKKTVPLDETIPTQMPEEEHLVYETLLTLQKKYKDILYLYYFENMAVSEIYSITGIKESTIRSHLTRGRQIMKEKLKGDYFYEK